MVTTTYCEPEDVSSLIQFRQPEGFTTTTKPTQEQIENMILDMEAEIERITGNAWKSVRVSNEYHDIDKRYKWGTGIPVFLNFRNIKTLDGDESDKLELWSGSDWEDWVAADSNFSEGRDNDYWLEEENGILWIVGRYRWLREVRIRITYRYGETTVPRDIKMACAMMVARELVLSDDRSVLFPEGTSNVSLNSKIDYWTKRIDEILNRYIEIRIGIK